MTTEPDPIFPELGVLAVAILDTDDYTQWCHLLKPVMAPTTFETLCYMVEACPVHCCDEQICRDDQDQTCPIGRGET